MSDEKLAEWIKRQLPKGYSLEQLRKILVSQGWPKRDVERALKKVDSGMKPQTEKVSSAVAKKAGGGSKKKILMLAIILAALALGVVAFFLLHRISTFAVYSPSPKQSSTQQATTQHSSIKNCGENLDCLAAESVNCAPSEAMISKSTMLMGVTRSSTFYYEVKGSTQGKCSFYIEVKKDDLSFSPKVSPSEIAKQKSSFKDQTGESATCLVDANYLSAMLTRWGHGILSPGLNSSECQGNYFS